MPPCYSLLPFGGVGDSYLGAEICVVTIVDRALAALGGFGIFLMLGDYWRPYPRLGGTLTAIGLVAVLLTPSITVYNDPRAAFALCEWREGARGAERERDAGGHAPFPYSVIMRRHSG